MTRGLVHLGAEVTIREMYVRGDQVQANLCPIIEVTIKVMANIIVKVFANDISDS